MATFSITELRVVEVIEQFTGIAGAAITQGQVVRFGTDGRVVPADAGSAATAGAVGIAVRSVTAGSAVTVLRHGVLDLGTALDGAAYGATVYLQSSGAIGDTAGTVSVPVGQVIAVHTLAGPQRLLRIHV